MITHEDDVMSVELTGEGIEGVRKQIAVGPRDGWQDGYMRIFTVAKGGHTSMHSHPWWHVNYILEGEGQLYIDGVTHPVRKGSVDYIEAGKLHQFVNTGSGDFRFICIVPPEGDHY